MLIFSQAKVTVRGPGEVRVEGLLEPHAIKIKHFVGELALERATIRYRWGRWLFSGVEDPGTRQRLLNFLVNECRMKRG
ncbi:MAG: hypothetical protein HS116_07575 [Planctomycetes bacterium]|nr:hypothetical protein [Planctomycetota bacterium]